METRRTCTAPPESAVALFTRLVALVEARRFGEAAKVRAELFRRHRWQCLWWPNPRGDRGKR